MEASVPRALLVLRPMAREGRNKNGDTRESANNILNVLTKKNYTEIKKSNMKQSGISGVKLSECMEM